jgi:hypothetical protein
MTKQVRVKALASGKGESLKGTLRLLADKGTMNTCIHVMSCHQERLYTKVLFASLLAAVMQMLVYHLAQPMLVLCIGECISSLQLLA